MGLEKGGVKGSNSVKCITCQGYYSPHIPNGNIYNEGGRFVNIM
jgi:hypothetical protein